MDCRKLILLTAILSFNLAFSQQIRVSSSSCIQQLPSKSVTRIHQDSAGYIWMGTLDGLCRYDGYRVLTFRSGYR
ncbi:MAG: hypothetical protein LBR64_06925, partial [Dysgonamonadaceae bacterium]|nr:hypothetical protein [Dysgonamonadaceae bacterium]